MIFSQLGSSRALPRWNMKSILLSVVLLALILPLSNAWRRHRHRRGRRIPISNQLHSSYRHSWNDWEGDVRTKRQGEYYAEGSAAESENWSDWTAMTECSRTCGGGVFMEARSCTIEGTCTGSDKRYSSCNVQDCPEGTKDFREEQCSRYDTVPFEGHYYAWLPYLKSPRRCELNCQPVGERYYYNYGAKVIDGTRCDSDSKDVCVDGECVTVGCDLIIGSDAKEDNCRVCGGDGSTCTTIAGVLDVSFLTVGYSDVVLIPKGATNITVDEVMPSDNFLALRNASGYYYLNGDYKILLPKAMKFAGTKVHYEKKLKGGLQAEERIRAKGPTNQTLYLVLLKTDRNSNPQIRFQFSIPKEIEVTENVVYEWRMGRWGDCSVTCGGGHVSRNISCVRSNDFETVDESLQLCDPRLKPETNKSCNDHPCQSSWQMGNWTDCTSECGTLGWQFHHVYCGQRVSEGRLAIINASACEDLEGPQPEEMRECNQEGDCPTWHIADWSPCDKLCGDGHQSRKVICHKVTNTSTLMLDEEECAEEKPDDTRACKAPSCVGTDWVLSDWTQCSSDCGSEVQTRKALCITAESKVVPEVICGTHRKPPLSRRCDEAPECAHRWYSSQWSACSETCGEGLKTRHVFCGQFEGGEVVSIVDGSKCDAESKPSSNETCVGDQECQKEWYTANFGKCSEVCGGGHKKRNIFCFLNENDLAYTDCDKDLKPFEKEPCNTQSCSEDEFLGTTKTYEEEELEWCAEDEIPEDGDEMSKDKDEMPEDEDKMSKDKHEMSEDEESVSETPGLESTLKDSLTTEEPLVTTEISDTTVEDSSQKDSSTTEEPSVTTEVSGTSEVDSTLEDSSTTEEPSVTTEVSGTSEVDSTLEDSTVTEESSGTSEVTETSGTDSTVEDLSTTEESSGTTVVSETSDMYSTVNDSFTTDESSLTTSGDYTTDADIMTTTEAKLNMTEDYEYDSSAIGLEINLDDSEKVEEGSGDETMETDEESGSGDIEKELNVTEVSTTLDDMDVDSTTLKPAEGTTEVKEGEMEEDGSGDFEEDASELKVSVIEEEIISTKDMEIKTTSAMPIDKKKKKDKMVKCKPRIKITCDESDFGCCRDGKTPAEGPFQEGCVVAETCKDTEHGCCPDDVSPARGPRFLGCPGLAICENSLFGCCPDNFTEAQGEDGEGCENLIEFNCKESRFGCCPDEITKATGPHQEGCKVEEPECGEESGSCIHCNETWFGCCPDGVTPAQGEGLEGCDEEASGEGSGDVTTGSGDGPSPTDLPTTTELTPACTRSPFGCCEDNFTAAHGEKQEGCCLASPFGCCPDHFSKAKGPSFQGCGCEFSAYGCCPDNETVSRGPENAGCGCEYTPFGCCPDKHTPALGANSTGCPCNTYEFGCCPDGVSIAQGPNKEGCGCAYTQFGCCQDERTPAQGLDNEGCGCETSQFGCCADGKTPAQGELFEGCVEEAPIVPGEVCGFAKERGPCQNYTVRYFFDINDGRCNRFYYGGCEGNLNRFDTEEECSATCIEPEGMDACGLPAVVGPCTGAQPSWYHDSVTETCQPFEYRGCHGNKNRFPSKGECEDVCVIPQKINICLLEVRPGPCRGNYSRWHYDQSVDQCWPFAFGGCKGNSNNFLSEAECKQRCIRGRSQDICSLPKSSGLCDETLPRWYYDYTETRCMPFYFTGCDGNANRFLTRRECETTCAHDDTGSMHQNVCALPKSTGNCTDHEERYYYDLFAGSCQQFLYSGCEGNENNYVTLEECQLACEDAKMSAETDVFATESCFLAHDQGTCGDFEALWYFDSSDGACKQFFYGGCGGNMNRFKTRQECDNRCGEVQDICAMPVVVGPCSGSFKQYFYDRPQDECLPFDYSGCQGNRNRFDSLYLCRQRCKTSTETATTSTQSPGAPKEVLPICTLPAVTGRCRALIPQYYYDPAHGACVGFNYGGCGGNVNRFNTIEHCDRQCGKFANKDVCNAPVEPGTCDGAFPKWHYDPQERVCKQFYYTGCEGNGNRFSTQEECEAECIYHDTIFPKISTPEANIAICELKQDVGPCIEGYKRFYFNTTSATCEVFTYGGCGGNQNRFKNFNSCTQYCQEASLKHSQQPPVAESTTPQSVDDPDCFAERQQCHTIQCPYGVRRSGYGVCQYCTCYDPCENMVCFQGSECSVELVQSKTETYEAVQFEAVCREVSKEGTCPPISDEITKCDQECESDASCSGPQKCCYNGCTYVCADVVTEEPTVVQPAYKPGPEETGVPAVITYSDTQVEVEENDVANLVCQARGRPTPAIGWYKNGEPINVASDGRFQLKLDYSLQIVNTRPSDAGTYRCVANNGIGIPDEREVPLNILDPNPRSVDIITPQEANPVVTLGSAVILRCWSVGWPVPDVSWWRGGIGVPRTSEKFETLPLGGLRISYVTIRDLGPYKCQAYNGVGRAVTHTFIIRALGPLKIVSPNDKSFLQYIVNPPRIPTFAPETTTTSFPAIQPNERPYWPDYAKLTSPPDTVTLSASIRTNKTKYIPFSDVTLPCDVEGSPSPSVTWYHNEDVIQGASSDRISVAHDNTLTIKNVEESDGGTYKCEVRNRFGETSSTVTITVEGVYVHPSCTDNPFFANCKLIVKAKYCTNTYYARFCCRSCTLTGQLPSFGSHLEDKSRRSKRK